MDTDSGRIGKPNGLSSQAIEPASRLDPDGLLSLARRCEEAAGPEYALERDIHAALGPAQRAIPLNYTASLDAAMALKPYNTVFIMSGGASCRATADLCVDGQNETIGYGEAATPALALCAAALRAHSAIAIEAGTATTEGRGP